MPRAAHRRWARAVPLQTFFGREGNRLATQAAIQRRSYTEAISGIAAPLSFLLVVIIALSILLRNEHFLSQDNWRIIIQSTAVVAILAIGETAVILTAGVDLSVGRVLAVSGVVAGNAMVNHHAGMWTGVLLACATGTVCGLANGLLTTFGRMPSFIATLGMMGVANGLALMISGDANISGLSAGFDVFSMGELFGTRSTQGIPMPLVLMVASAVVVHLLLSRTAWGRSVYAVGGNRDAARLSGISLRRVTLSVFMLSGLLAGFAAVIHISRTGGAQPTAGTGLELQAIAATVIGGTSLMGGVGGVAGTLIGAFLMAVIQNGCDLRGIHPHYQLIIIGAVIWLAAMYDGYRRKTRVFA